MTDQHFSEGFKWVVFWHLLSAISCLFLLPQGSQAQRQCFSIPSCREGNLFLIRRNKQVTSNTKFLGVLAFLIRQYQSSLQKMHVSTVIKSQQLKTSFLWVEVPLLAQFLPSRVISTPPAPRASPMAALCHHNWVVQAQSYKLGLESLIKTWQATSKRHDKPPISKLPEGNLLTLIFFRYFISLCLNWQLPVIAITSRTQRLRIPQILVHLSSSDTSTKLSFATIFFFLHILSSFHLYQFLERQWSKNCSLGY